MRKFGQFGTSNETHKIPQKPEEEKQEVIPVAGKQVTIVENTVTSKGDIEINDSEIDPNVEPEDHHTIISPRVAGKFNFIINCKCYWQGRTVTMNEANKIAKEHRELHKNDHKVKH